ncbi:MAG: hypothetical protein ACOX8T_11995 [Bacillota bacterium]|jgi:hypothetical protein
MATEHYASILQAMMDEQKRHREENPVQMYFEPGTPTLATRQLEEQTALQREKMAQDAALAREQMALQRELASMGGGGSGGGGGFSGTAGERSALATAAFLEEGHLIYQENLKTKSKKTGKRLKYPLYYTLNTLMNNPAKRAEAIAMGADLKAVVDQLIGAYTNMTPEQYFNSPTGSKLAGSYAALTGKSGGGSSSGRFQMIGGL